LIDQRRAGLWVTVAWMLLIVSGASTTGLLRAPVANPSVVPVAFHFHRFAGTLVGLIGLALMIRAGRRDGWRWPGAALAGGTVALGWLCARSLAPLVVVVHAFIAAFATVSLASATTVASPSSESSRSRARWMTVSAQLAFGLVAAQVVAGAFLRHQQIGLLWHLLVGGLAVVALLAPAVAIRQDPVAPIVERRAATWAITAVVIQVALGVAVLLMILVGPPSVAAWLGATIAHVTVGTLTLLAAARFAAAVAR
jgi:hypothetical protein